MAKEYTNEQLSALKALKEYTDFLRKSEATLDRFMSEESSLKYAIRRKKEELWNIKESISREKKDIRQMKKQIRKIIAHNKFNSFDLAKNSIQ